MSVEQRAPASAVECLAFYLPQYHPIPENDRWWGAGFTEWRNVVRAGPLFRGHAQPHLPADLGFYDLRVPETRQAQAELAAAAGITGFCYYHYWFNGQRLLERPLDDVLAQGAPDFPFALCWANEDWTRRWDGRSNEYLIQQSYSDDDDRRHIRWLLRTFTDGRYIRVAGKPLLLIYRASLLPDPRRTLEIWREEAARSGAGELYICRVESNPAEHGDPRPLGFDAAVEFQPDWDNLGQPLRRSLPWRALRRAGLTASAYGEHKIYDYAAVVQRQLRKPSADYPRYPCVTPSWDNTARRKRDAVILRNSTPEVYGDWLAAAAQRSPATPDARQMVFVNAWNEWAEGNHLEPDVRFGHAYLEATRHAMQQAGRDPTKATLSRVWRQTPR